MLGLSSRWARSLASRSRGLGICGMDVSLKNKQTNPPSLPNGWGPVTNGLRLPQTFAAPGPARRAGSGDRGQQPDAGTVNLCGFAIKPRGAGTWLPLSRFRVSAAGALPTGQGDQSLKMTWSL